MASEQSFALVFASVCTIVALWPWVRGGRVRLWAILVAVSFTLLGWAWPAVLWPLNVAWFRLGLLIGAVTTPVVLALLYVTTFLPTGLVAAHGKRCAGPNTRAGAIQLLGRAGRRQSRAGYDEASILRTGQ